jgi:hypothetical protein
MVILIFKGLIARRLYKSFGVKGLMAPELQIQFAAEKFQSSSSVVSKKETGEMFSCFEKRKQLGFIFEGFVQTAVKVTHTDNLSIADQQCPLCSHSRQNLHPGYKILS